MIPARGLKNGRSICHFNSVLQSLFSCPDVVDYFLTQKCVTPVAQKMKNIIMQMKTSPVGTVLDPYPIVQEITKLNPKFGHGEEDAGEGLLMLIDAVKSRRFKNLFLFRYAVFTKCSGCDVKMALQKDESFMVTCSDISSAHVLRHEEQLEKKCKCGSSSFTRTYRLTRAPPVQVFLLNKFAGKKIMRFPQELVLVQPRPLVSKIEHLRSHYLAHCHRDQPYMLNDSAVSRGTMVPSPNTYLVFYN